MVDGKNRQGSLEALIAKRQSGRRGSYDRRSLERPLTDHDHGGLDRDESAVLWLIRAGTGTDVDYGLRISEGFKDPGPEPRIRSSKFAVAPSYGIVENHRPTPKSAHGFLAATGQLS